MRRMLEIILVAGLLSLGMLLFCDDCGAASQTGSELIQELRENNVAFDTARFPDSVLLGFINSQQRYIAVKAKTKWRDTTIVPTSAAYQFDLPSDFYHHNAVTLNEDPYRPPSSINAPAPLTYKRKSEMNTRYSPFSGRPTEYSVWSNDTAHVLVLNRLVLTGIDTLTMSYFAYPSKLDSTEATIDLPEVYWPLLKDLVKSDMFDRITFTGPAREATLLRIEELEAELLPDALPAQKSTIP